MSVGDDRTGTETLATIAAGRTWWRLGAGDIQPWVRPLHFSAVEDDVSRTELIGSPWDGISNIEVDRAAGPTVSKAEVRDGAFDLHHAIRAVRIEAIGTGRDATGDRVKRMAA